MTAPLRSWFDAHQRTHPIPGLSFQRFAARVAEAELPDEARSLDIYLALACQERLPEGAKQLLRCHRTTIDSALRGLRLPAERTEEVRSIFLESLFVGEAGTPAIERYAGRGSLGGWLRVTVSRSAHRLLRKRDELRLVDSTPESGYMGIWHDPERDALRDECKDAFARAMTEALDDLPADDHEALALHYLQRVSIDGLAARWKVHRATAARRIARVRCRLREAVLVRLESRLGLSASSALRMVREAQSRLHASLWSKES